jgi:hypothetical protein
MGPRVTVNGLDRMTFNRTERGEHGSFESSCASLRFAGRCTEFTRHESALWPISVISVVGGEAA